MLDDLLRIGIVFLSVVTIPYLILLIKGLWVESTNKKNKQTHYLLLFLFIVMLIASCLSLVISSLGIFYSNGFLDTHGYVNRISRLRTFLLSAGNFALATYFYKIYSNGGR